MRLFECGAGYCVFNDVAVATNYLKKKGYAKKVLIIDLDVHQGNGNSEIFKNDKNSTNIQYALCI